MRIAVALSVLAALASGAIACASAAMATGYHVQYAFTGGSGGEGPHAALTNYHGKFYGTVPAGGANGFGAVYEFDPATGVETTAYSFKGGSDGEGPYSNLINIGGTLYGTTFTGGASNLGTVYAFDPATGVETVVYAFKGGADGAYPGNLLNVGRTLYGTTVEGGGYTSYNCDTGSSCGTVFSLNPTTGAEAVVYAFTGGSDGSNPHSNLVEIDGSLYGTGSHGGESSNCLELTSCGMVFSIDPTSGVETVVYAFKGQGDGSGPNSLIEVDGMLYGTTEEGGVSTLCVDRTFNYNYGCGTIFSLDPTTGAKTELYSFRGGSDGAIPEASLVEVSGLLYGVTGSGGRKSGTVFSLSPMTQVETVLHSFHGAADGRAPLTALLSWGHQLWGTTDEGGDSMNCGSDGCGTVYSIRP